MENWQCNTSEFINQSNNEDLDYVGEIMIVTSI